MKKLQLFATYLFLVALIGCDPYIYPPQWNQNLITEIEPETKLLIGGSSETNLDEMMIGRIGEIHTDPFENLFISDQISQSIKKLNNNGDFLKEIGRRGRGAGEFIGLKSFTIVSGTEKNSEQIIAVDEMNRMISIYSTEGELITVLNAPTGLELRGKLKPLILKDAQKFMFLYKLHEQAPDKDCLFHLYDHNFKKKEQCFGSFQDLRYYKNEAFHYMTQSNPGHFVIGAENTVYYTPRYFDGVIYKFTYDAESKNWALANQLYGFVHHTKPLEENAEPANYRLSYQGKRLTGRILNLSLGLFKSSTGLVHFTRTTSPDGEIWFGVEKYNQNGKLENYFKISGVDNGDLNRWIEVQYRDDEGNYYYSDNHEIPAIYQMSFHPSQGL